MIVGASLVAGRTRSKGSLYVLSVNWPKKPRNVSGSNDLGTECWTTTLHFTNIQFEQYLAEVGSEPKEDEGVAENGESERLVAKP